VNRFLIVSLALIAGCSSLVDDHCAHGYLRDDGTCVARANDVDGGIAFTADARMVVENIRDGGAGAPDAGPDASTDAMVADAAPDAIVIDAPVIADASPDAPSGPTCTAPLESCYGTCVDLDTDADHCGSCTHSCASGICSAGHCQGEPWGHIVAIGHDYSSYHASQRRVLVNAVSLGSSNDVAVTWWPGDTRSMTHMTAFTSGMAATGRQWHQVAFPTSQDFTGIDVVVVPPDTGDGAVAEATGATWASTLDAFLRTGGVVVVLDGANGVNYRFAHGAQLFDVGAPVVVTGQPTAVVNGTDALADQVIAPYLAEASSISWPNAPQPVVTTMGGTDTIVFHVAR
jgi:Stigma-specific protein, Stig1